MRSQFLDISWFHGCVHPDDVRFDDVVVFNVYFLGILHLHDRDECYRPLNQTPTE